MIPVETASVVKVSIEEVLHTFGEAMILVVLVVFLFLQNWRATLIPILAIPVSLIGTFIFFIPFGFTINTLTLFAFVLAIGIVVDDAIVVVEAVQHYIDEKKMSPRAATEQAMKDISGPGNRYCVDPCGGIRAGGFRTGYRRTPLSAICDHDRCFGTAFRICGAFAYAGALLDYAASF